MKDSNLSNKKNSQQIISEDSVSLSYPLVERPETIPWKDYVDFAWTINDENPKDR